ncbi:MAG: NADPH-dependent 7-cyano-7-deazaguanine reductase QueF [Azoarcus sp.]|jgi:7-cyano-7-deazaguanine reductase|nr:NADPH-dependent 7-cyano-7-deazaguanine reductase QueF [Azoarcus sp.]
MNVTKPSEAHDSPLGKRVAYRDDYASELLFPIARQGKRDELGIRGEALPFVGEDLWNAYELSWLNARGKPVVALGRFRFPANSPNLVESKSLKLYLNSFNQSRMGSVDTVRTVIARDLAAAAGANVAVEVIPLSARPVRQSDTPVGICLDELDIDIDTYDLRPDFLRAEVGTVCETLFTHLLKSNCPVTGQPDWAMLAVCYSGPAIDRAGLLRYVVSLRRHDEFHEQCVERIFCDILAHCRPTALAVWARYTRRGGLDINPFRAMPGAEDGGWCDFGSEIRQ